MTLAGRHGFNVKYIIIIIIIARITGPHSTLHKLPLDAIESVPKVAQSGDNVAASRSIPAPVVCVWPTLTSSHPNPGRQRR